VGRPVVHRPPPTAHVTQSGHASFIWQIRDGDAVDEREEEDSKEAKEEELQYNFYKEVTMPT